MAQKSWHLDRRTFLSGIGVSLTLPYLDAMAESVQRQQNKGVPKRLCCVYFPNGCGIPDQRQHAGEHQQWSWFPMGKGSNYTFTNTLSVLEPHRDNISVLGGLSHPRSRNTRAHCGVIGTHPQLQSKSGPNNQG